DTAALGWPDRLAATVDILLAGAGETAHHGPLGAPGDLVDSVEIALGRDREPGLDDVDAHVVEEFGDLELFLVGHGGARRLLAVAQGGVEDDNAVLLGLWLRGHGNCSFFTEMPEKIAPAGPFLRFRSGTPGVPGRRAPSRPSGANKEQRGRNEGGGGAHHCPPADRANVAAHRHAKPSV